MKITNQEVKIARFLTAIFLFSPAAHYLNNVIGMPYNSVEFSISFNQLNWLTFIVSIFSIITSYKTIFIESNSISLIDDGFVRHRYHRLFIITYVLIIIICNPLTEFSFRENSSIIIYLLISVFFAKEFLIKILISIKAKSEV